MRSKKDKISTKECSSDKMMDTALLKCQYYSLLQTYSYVIRTDVRKSGNSSYQNQQTWYYILKPYFVKPMIFYEKPKTLFVDHEKCHLIQSEQLYLIGISPLDALKP